MITTFHHRCARCVRCVRYVKIVDFKTLIKQMRKEYKSDSLESAALLFVRDANLSVRNFERISCHLFFWILP